jgi:hypothetical protein
VNSKSSWISNKSKESKAFEQQPADLQAPFLEESDSEDNGNILVVLTGSDPWDKEKEAEEARLRDEIEAADIAAAIKSGKKPVSSKLRVKDASASDPRRGKSLKKWFKGVLKE